MLNSDLTALNDAGAIQGLDAREDGVYITYTPVVGADSVTKKLGNPAPVHYQHRYDGNWNASINIYKVKDINSITFIITRPAYGAFGVYGQTVPNPIYTNGTLLTQLTGTLANKILTVDVSAWDYINVSEALTSSDDTYIISDYS